MGILGNLGIHKKHFSSPSIYTISLACLGMAMQGCVEFNNPNLSGGQNLALAVQMIGHNDGFNRNGNQCHIAGWAVDLNHQENSTTIRFYTQQNGSRILAHEMQTSIARPGAQTSHNLSHANVGYFFDIDQTFGSAMCDISPPISVEVVAYSTVSKKEYPLTNSPSLVGREDQLPLGQLDSVNNNSCLASGWAGDPDTNDSIEVALYLDGPFNQGGTLLGTTTANRPHSQNTMPGNRGFEFQIPNQHCASGSHTLYAYALGNLPGSSALLSGSPANFGVQQPGLKRFFIENPLDGPLQDLFLVTIPFKENVVPNQQELSKYRVQAPNVASSASRTRVLEWYRDSNGNPLSVRLAQFSFRDTLNTLQKKSYDIVNSGSSQSSGNFTLHPTVQSQLSNTEFTFDIRDANSVSYIADIGDVVKNQDGATLYEDSHRKIIRKDIFFNNQTGDPQVLRHASFYPVVANQPRPIAKATLYITYHSQIPFIDVSTRIGNHFLGSDNPNGSSNPDLYPVGPVFYQSGRIFAEGMKTLSLENHDWWDMPHPTRHQAGQFYEGQLFTNVRLADGSSTRMVFRLGYYDANTSQSQQQLIESSAEAMIYGKAYGLADYNTWVSSPGTLGVLGEISEQPNEPGQYAQSRYNYFLGQVQAKKGFMTLMEDIANTAQTGTPRQNHGILPWFVEAIFGDYPKLISRTIAMAAVQLHRANLSPGSNASDPNQIGLIYDCSGIVICFRGRDLSDGGESFGRRQLINPIRNSLSNDPYTSIRGPGNHEANMQIGYNAFDYEHPIYMGAYTAWIATGEHLFQEQIEMAAHSAMGMMKRPITEIARSGGSSMIVILQGYLATGSADIRNWLNWKIGVAKDDTAANWHPAKQFTNQRNPPTTWSGWHLPNAQYDIDFFMPWQQGFVATAYLSLYKHLGNIDALELAENTIHSGNHCIVRNHQDPQFGFVAWGIRYYCPSNLIDKNNNNNVVIINPDYFDATSGPKWGSSPAGGAAIFLGTPMAYLSEVARTETLRNQARDIFIHVVGTNPNYENRWIHQIPIRFMNSQP